MRLRGLIGGLAFAAVALSAGAESLVAQSPAPVLVPIPTRTYIGIDPIGLPIDIATVELETAVAPGVTVGGVASYIDVTDPKYTTFDFKLRYYPGEVVLRGLSVGATAGYTHFSNNPVGVRQTLDAPTLGIITDYNWLYGRDQHFLIGTGIGAKRVLASSADRARVDIDRAVVTARLIVGFAF